MGAVLTEPATGVIFDVKRYSVHDGPGVRTTAFLKGCTLRCLWCHSPESQRPEPEVVYIPEICLGCGECAKACPLGLLAGGPAALDRVACQGCGRCADSCYAGALRLVGRRIGVAELVALLDRDRLLHEVSGGGVTLSGGEPALQPAFAASVLEELRGRGHHTAVETAGNVPWDHLALLAGNADLILYDLKHVSPAAHRSLTGAGNERVLANLSAISALAARGATGLLVRMPVVPGRNDAAGDVEAAASFLASLPGLDGVELLPYHNLGVPKYAGLGRQYAIVDQASPEPGRMREIAAVLAGRGLKVSVEGMT